MTYIPIVKAAMLDDLDQDEVLEGYNDGTNNEPEPKGNRSHSYWHGWRNGMVDGGHNRPDAAQLALAGDYLEEQRKKK